MYGTGGHCSRLTIPLQTIAILQCFAIGQPLANLPAPALTHQPPWGSDRRVFATWSVHCIANQQKPAYATGLAPPSSHPILPSFGATFFGRLKGQSAQRAQCLGPDGESRKPLFGREFATRWERPCAARAIVLGRHSTRRGATSGAWQGAPSWKPRTRIMVGVSRFRVRRNSSA